MNEQVGKKRDWIKNAAIVFLVIMLVLTFFSNTFMNYSLPEVSAQYITSGTIQAKVRGSGVISAGDPYTVKAEGTKTVESVLVKNGDHVEKGDVLLYLEVGDSKELEEAEKLLDDLIKKYQEAALAENVDPATTNSILNGHFTSFQTYKTKVNALKKEIEALEADIKVYEQEVAKIEAEKKAAENETTSASPEKKAAYDKAVAERIAAEQVLTKAIAEAAKVNSKVVDAKTAQEALDNDAASLKEAQKAVTDITGSTQYQQAEAQRVGYENTIAAAKAIVESGTASDAEKAQAKDDWDAAEKALAAHLNSSIYTQLEAAKAHLAAVEAGPALYEAVIAADDVLTAAKATEAQAKREYEAAGPDHSTAIAQYENIIKLNQQYIDEKKAVVTTKQTELTNLLAQMTQENTLSSELEAIEQQREVIEKLRGGDNGGNIVAPITGTVQDLSLTAGGSTTAGEAVATILPDGKGYTMEVSVNKNQAQRLSVGDVADLQNSWYYSDVSVVLKQIKTDKNNPTENRILVFDVQGSDLTNGQSLSISIGQKSANYDCIVPNSAIREDSNGKFILIVTQKSSPLGNRYYAERVDVEVLGSDDTQSAISGAVSGWEFVITTSTKPVEAGQLIRLAD